MKINEITQLSDKTLLEEFSKDTAIKPENMLEMYRAANTDNWVEVEENEFFEMLDGIRPWK